MRIPPYEKTPAPAPKLPLITKPPRPRTPQFVSELKRIYTRRWKYIVIHHSASDTGDAASIDKYHRDVKGWKNGLGYHFVIGNGSYSRDGQVEIGRRWVKQLNGAHAGVNEYNQYGIGICLVGNFEENHPTNAQIRSLIDLAYYLQQRCDIPFENILMHRHVRDTACPGRNFPYYELLANFAH